MLLAFLFTILYLFEMTTMRKVQALQQILIHRGSRMRWTGPQKRHYRAKRDNGIIFRSRLSSSAVTSSSWPSPATTIHGGWTTTCSSFPPRTGQICLFTGTTNNNDAENDDSFHPQDPSPFVAIPELSTVEDDLGNDGVYFESTDADDYNDDQSPPAWISDDFQHQVEEQEQEPGGDFNRRFEQQEERRAQQREQQRAFLLQELNPSQVEAVTQPVPTPPPPFNDMGLASTSTPITNAVITRVVAGPGSGKTRVLTCRIVHLLLEDPHPHNRVLAVTFTRKAAGEMKERVERLLREEEEHLLLFLDNSNKDAAALGRGMENNKGREDETVRLDRYGQVIVTQEEYGNSGHSSKGYKPPPRGLERVELGTFHSVCAKIMRYNGSLLNSLPSVQRDLSRASPVELPMSPGALDDDSDVDINESNSSLSTTLVAPEANLNGQFAIVDQAEQIRIVKECLKDREIDIKLSDVKPMEILSRISHIKDKFAQNEDPFRADNSKKGRGSSTPALTMARKLYFSYREKLLVNNAVDFDDLILMTRELLMEHEDLRERLHRRWPHVLVDEFQDTSRTQMDLVKLLTSSSLFVVGDADQSIYSWRGAHVGSMQDVKIEFEPYGAVHTVYLKENYRSTSNIVRAAEKVISSNQKNKLTTSLTEEEMQAPNGGNVSNDDIRRSMKPKRGAGPSPRIIACEDERAEANFVVDTILNMTTKEELTHNHTVAIIYRTNAQSRYLEEACVNKNLPYVIRGGAGGFYKRAEIKDSLCFLRWLYNGDDEGSMLRAFKTPSKGIGEKAIAEFRAYCDKVQEFYRRIRPLNQRPTPLDILISMSTGESAGDRSTQLADSAPDAVDFISKRALSKFVEFSSKMRDFRSKAFSKTVDQLLFYIIEELQLMEHFDQISKSKAELSDRQENVQELRQAAKKYATYGSAMKSGRAMNVLDDENFMGDDSALGIFLDDVALVSDATEAESDGDDASKASNRMVVNLMTIHASKGTEYDAVFVVGLEEGTLPCSPALQDGAGSQQLEEERRLCYVAMTRAKTNLILTWRREVTSFSSWSDSGPKTINKKRSRFLDALVSKKGKSTTTATIKTATTKAKQVDSFQVDSLLLGKRPDVKNGIKRQQGTPAKPQSISRDFTRKSPTFQSLSRTKEAPLSNGQRNIGTSTRGSASAAAKAIPSADRIKALRASLSKSGLHSDMDATAQVSRQKKKKSKAATSSQSSSSTKATTAAAVSESPHSHLVDPSWFFPVGEAVIHRNFGRGVVLDHPPYTEIDDALVRIRFENGRTMEFPALGSDILPEM